MASNNHAALASQAHSCFNAGQYDRALQLLQQISAQMSEEKWEVRVAHNIALAEYARSGFVNSNDLQTALTNISKKAKERNTSSSKDSKQGEAKSEQTEAEPSILLYNLALLHFQQKRYGECQKILEHLYLNIAPMDEELALHVCFLLLDILIHNARGNLYNPSDQERFAQQMSTILSFLEKPHALNGGGENSSSSDPKKDDSDGQKDSQRLPEQIEFSFRLHLYKAKILLLQQNVKLSKKEIKCALEIFQRELRESDSNPSSSTPNAPPGLTASSNAAQNNTSTNMTQNNGAPPSGNTGLFHPLPPPTLQNHTALYLKANLEYLRENYSKCLKLLGTVCGGGSNPVPSTPGQAALYYNNLACAHYKMGKYHMALRFFKRALAAAKTDGIDGQQTPARSPCPGMVSPTYSSEVVYNTGLQLLLLGQPLPAFKCLESAALLYYNRPRLWLRLAECCLHHYAQQKADLVLKSGQKSPFLREVGVGQGEQRRALLPLRSGSMEPKQLLQSQDDGTWETSPDGEESKAASEAGGLGPVHMRAQCTLPYAVKCLKNVVYLCAARESYKGGEGETEASAFGNTASNLFSPTDEGQGSESEGGADDEVLCAALVALAYVQLILNNPVEAYRSAKRLLDLGVPAGTQGEEATGANTPSSEGQGSSGAHLHRRSLCRLYASEALVLLGRVHEAADMLAPGGDLEVEENSDSSAESSTEMTANLHVALANVHVKQENYSEAEVHIQTALSLQPSSIEALRALVYILLRQKETRRALQILKTGRL